MSEILKLCITLTSLRSSYSKKNFCFYVSRSSSFYPCPLIITSTIKTGLLRGRFWQHMQQSEWVRFNINQIKGRSTSVIQTRLSAELKNLTATEIIEKNELLTWFMSSWRRLVMSYSSKSSSCSGCKSISAGSSQTSRSWGYFELAALEHPS